MPKTVLQIFATDRKTGIREEITDLYWFEENGVHDFEGDGHTGKYEFDYVLTGPPRR